MIMNKIQKKQFCQTAILLAILYCFVTPLKAIQGETQIAKPIQSHHSEAMK